MGPSEQATTSFVGDRLLVGGDYRRTTGFGGIGKNWLAPHKAAPIPGGHELLGFKTRKCRVGPITFEMDWQLIQERLEATFARLGLTPEEPEEVLACLFALPRDDLPATITEVDSSSLFCAIRVP